MQRERGHDSVGYGNPPCIGYELRADLDFNTNGSATSTANPAGASSGDTYWNGGAGWNPIGATTTRRTANPYTGDFDGNADTDASGDGGPYTISNLFINPTTGGSHWGLFGRFWSSNQTVEDVGLVNVDITVNLTTHYEELYVGGLCGDREQRDRGRRGQLYHRQGAGRGVGGQPRHLHGGSWRDLRGAAWWAA